MRNAIKNKPTTTAPAELSSMPPGVDVSMTPATMKSRNISTPVAVLMMKDEMPRPECFFSTKVSPVTEVPLLMPNV